METTPKILLIGEVASLLRVSIPTVNRWLYLSRRGQGHFPLPISVQRGKCRWLSTDIEHYISSQANTSTPLVDTVSPSKRRQDAKAFKQRQEAADVALARHGYNRKPPSEKVYLLRTTEQILFTADRESTPIVNHADSIHYYTGTHYKPVSEMELQNFLIEATIQSDVPPDIAVYQAFVERMIKQFMINSARHNSRIAEPDTSHINLRNGTVFFDRNGHRFKRHSHKRFIRHCLHFGYDETATAPLWQQHLDRALPHPDKQQYLAKCLALPFYNGRIEKAPIFYGQNDTGKSTTLEVFKALIGAENYTSESLSALTKTDTQGDYARARLDGKIANIVSDISAHISDDGMTKTLISREAVPARHPYGTGFDMRCYARLLFALNELPTSSSQMLLSPNERQLSCLTNRSSRKILIPVLPRRLSQMSYPAC